MICQQFSECNLKTQHEEKDMKKLREESHMHTETKPLYTSPMGALLQAGRNQNQFSQTKPFHSTPTDHFF